MFEWPQSMRIFSTCTQWEIFVIRAGMLRRYLYVAQARTRRVSASVAWHKWLAFHYCTIRLLSIVCFVNSKHLNTRSVWNIKYFYHFNIIYNYSTVCNNKISSYFYSPSRKVAALQNVLYVLRASPCRPNQVSRDFHGAQKLWWNGVGSDDFISTLVLFQDADWVSSRARRRIIFLR